MLKYMLICLLASSHGINGRPQIAADLASHILIVTPQAQVHLEPALKYDALAPSTFIQHLSPLARIAAPHEETIIYVPSGAAINHASANLARSSAAIAEPLRKQETKQYEQISQQIEQAQAAIQQGTSAIGPQLSEAASAAASAASNAGSGFFPALFPPAAPAAPAASASSASSQKIDKIEYEALPASPLLLSQAAEGRRVYALTPAVSHVIDFVHAPVFVGPLSAVRARSALPEEQQKDKLIEAAPLVPVDSFKDELPASGIFLEKKEPIPFVELPKMGSDRVMINPNSEEIKLEANKFEEKLPLEKFPLEQQLKKEEPAKKEFIAKEKVQFRAQSEPQAESLERREEVKEYKAPDLKLPQERKEELKEYKEGEKQVEALKHLQAEQQKPFEAKEKYLEKAELKEIREEFKKEEKQAETPQAQQQQKAGFKPEGIKAAAPAAEGQNLKKNAFIIPEKQEEPQIIGQQQSLRASSGRTEASEVVPVHAHVHHEDVVQHKKAVLPVNPPVVPSFVPPFKSV